MCDIGKMLLMLNLNIILTKKIYGNISKKKTKTLSYTKYPCSQEPNHYQYKCQTNYITWNFIGKYNLKSILLSLFLQLLICLVEWQHSPFQLTEAFLAVITLLFLSLKNVLPVMDPFWDDFYNERDIKNY